MNYKTHKKCSIRNCENRTTKEISLFELPGKPDSLIQKWFTALRIKKQTKKMFVCSEHFIPDDFGKQFHIIIDIIKQFV